MGVTLPEEAHAMLIALGVPWPNVDEDEIHKDADAWRTVLAMAEPSAARADATMRGAQESYRGEGSTELAGYWNETGGNGGHQSQAIAAARSAPVVLDNTAWLTTGVKVAVGTAAVITTVRVARAFLAGGPFGGAMATAEMLRSRALIGKIQREGAEGAGKVIAPALARGVTQPFRRVLENMRRPALAGAGGPRITWPRTVGPRATTGPRHARDYMASMGRSNNNARRGGNGRRGGGRRNSGGRADSTDGTTAHAADRQAQRGISDDMIEQTKQSGKKRAGNQPGTTVYETESVRVVENKRGGIISAIWKRK
ncbi:hypothetical protein ACFLIM_13595 [Nonomuraea sp. M3C6]|uniref:DUF4258 domain-containing protein n=1 Tax=Nonomuraea marmarensis TaxID=3351344 RepID=A0ABW7AB03_9ACTN